MVVGVGGGVVGRGPGVAAGRSTLRACRPDYCAGGADLGLLRWAGSLRVGAPVGAAGRPTMRACRPGFVVVVVDLGLLG